MKNRKIKIFLGLVLLFIIVYFSLYYLTNKLNTTKKTIISDVNKGKLANVGTVENFNSLVAKKVENGLDINKDSDVTFSEDNNYGIIKQSVSNGRYLFTCSAEYIVISDIQNGLGVANKIANDNLEPVGLILNNNQLIVIGVDTVTNKDEKKDESYNLTIYNIKDNGSLVKAKTYTFYGNIYTVRIIDGALYVIYNKEIPDSTDPNVSRAPKYSIDGTAYSVDYTKIYSLPNLEKYKNFSICAAINLSKLSDSPRFTTILGSLDNIYISSNNIYMACAEYKLLDKNISSSDKTNVYSNTYIYKFRLDGYNMQYTANSKSEGNIINETSLNEYDNLLRAAMTNYANTTTSIDTFDQDMNKVGTMVDISKGNLIHSTNYIKNKVYIITDKVSNPVFVFDLLEQKKLCEITSVNNIAYVSQYDDNNIIALGINPTEISNTSGNTTSKSTSLESKIYMLDVSNMQNISKKSELVISDSKTYLDNLENVIIDSSKNIIGIPVNVLETPPNIQKIEYITEDIFDGTYIKSDKKYQAMAMFKVSSSKELSAINNVTHYESGPNMFLYSNSYNIFSTLIDQNTMYTISKRKIQSYDISLGTKRGEVYIIK